MSKVVIDRAVVEQALEALEYAQQGRECPSTTRQAITAFRAALAQQAEPVARECSDPMCACRGGPCAECEEGEREKEIEDLRFSLYFYQRRCEALQSWQSKMRDPERTIVCDILANGKTLDSAVAGDRYTAPPQRLSTQNELSEAMQTPRAMAQAYEAGWRAALAQLQQVGWMQKSTGVIRCDWGFDTTGYVPVYAAQEQSE